MLKSFIINRLINSLIGASTYEIVYNLVLSFATMKMSGAEKNKKVKETLQNLKIDVSTSALNLAIELAVSQLKLKGI